MSTFVSNSAELLMLQHVLAITSPNQTIHLYKNNYTPVEGSTATDFTQSTFTGYTQMTLDRTGWSFSTVSGSAVGQYSACTFSCTGGSAETVYGFYLTENTGNALLYCEKFPTARVVSSGTDLTVTPKISLTNNDA